MAYQSMNNKPVNVAAAGYNSSNLTAYNNGILGRIPEPVNGTIGTYGHDGILSNGMHSNSLGLPLYLDGKLVTRPITIQHGNPSMSGYSRGCSCGSDEDITDQLDVITLDKPQPQVEPMKVLDMTKPEVVKEVKELLIHMPNILPEVGVIRDSSQAEAERKKVLNTIRGTQYWDKYSQQYIKKVADETGNQNLHKNGVITKEGVLHLVANSLSGAMTPLAFVEMPNVAEWSRFMILGDYQTNHPGSIIPPHTSSAEQYSGGLVSSNTLALIGLVGVVGLGYFVFRSK